MKYLYFLLLSISLVSCKSNANQYLFYVDDRADFLFIVESANVLAIETDSLQYFVKAENIDSGCVYKKYAEIRSNNTFSANVILKIDTLRTYRYYEFSVNSYQKKIGLIESFVFAKLDDNKQILCTGYINQYFSIARKCGSETEIKELDTAGYIRKYSRW